MGESKHPYVLKFSFQVLHWNCISLLYWKYCKIIQIYIPIGLSQYVRPSRILFLFDKPILVHPLFQNNLKTWRFFLEPTTLPSPLRFLIPYVVEILDIYILNYMCSLHWIDAEHHVKLLLQKSGEYQTKLAMKIFICIAVIIRTLSEKIYCFPHHKAI